MTERNCIDESVLREGGKLFELFWLRPKRHMDKSVTMRLRINKKWSGWKVKDELIASLGLEVGDTISTEITPYYTSGIIDDNNDTDLFASAHAADWLLDNNVGVGTIIDCVVRFAYTSAPIGLKGKIVSKISLIIEKGISVVDVDQKYITESIADPTDISSLLHSFLG